MLGEHFRAFVCLFCTSFGGESVEFSFEDWRHVWDVWLWCQNMYTCELYTVVQKEMSNNNKLGKERPKKQTDLITLSFLELAN